MSKIKFGAPPKNFPATIKVPMLDGTEGTVKVSFIYRTRTAFGEFIDGLMDAAGLKPVSTDDADIKATLAQAMERTIDSNADYLMKVIGGWDLDVEFSLDSAKQLCDEYPGVAIAIMERYRVAITEGRLGN